MKKVSEVLKEVLEKINPSEKELNSIDEFLKDFISNLEKRLHKRKIDAEVFIGGSFAKKTIIKKGQYDIDIFVRFGEKYKGRDISEITLRALKEVKLKKSKKIILVHGSRDYFKINVSSSFFVEVIPVMRVRNPKSAENITDLSYFHVNYIKKKLKTEKMLEEVRLAKAFCHANKCYGAESYINGFSGYALELLVYYYKNFLGFVKGMADIKEKEFIDIEKMYRNKYEITLNMNSAKMASPIVLIDPTYKERNALAALSEETFEKFREVCRKFLKSPSEKDFEIRGADLERIKKNAHKNRSEFILLDAKTDRQEGDIAGSKLLKFYRHLQSEIGKFYNVGNRGFEYNGTREAKYFFVVKKKGEITFQGPNLKDKKNVSVFKRHHENTFEKGDRIYATDKFNEKIEEFIKKWKLKNSDKMKSMHMTKLEII